MRQHQRARILTAVLKAHPGVVASVVNIAKPSLRDTSLIADIYTHYTATTPTPTCKDDEYSHKITFISIVLHLFDPIALYNHCMVTGRICSLLADVMGYNNRQSVSELVGVGRAYIKNPGFRSNVEDIAAGIMEVFQDRDVVNVGQVSLFGINDGETH